MSPTGATMQTGATGPPGGAAAGGIAGMMFIFQASGLDPNQTYAVFIGNTQVKTGKTNGSGGAIDTFTVPVVPPGATRLVVATSAHCGQHVFTVLPTPM